MRSLLIDQTLWPWDRRWCPNPTGVEGLWFGDGIAVAVVNALLHQDIHVYHVEIATGYRYIYICKEYNGFKTEKKYIEHPGLQGQHPGDNLNLANGFGIILSDKSVKWMWLYNCEVFLSVDGSFLFRSACWLGMLGFESGIHLWNHLGSATIKEEQPWDGQRCLGDYPSYVHQLYVVF